MAELTNRTKHEASFAGKLGKLSGRHRRELQDLLGFPPDVSKVPESFWLRVQRETEEELIALLLLIFIAAATQHRASASEAQGRAAQFASLTARDTAKSYTDTGREMLRTGGQEWAETTRTGGTVTRASVLDRTNTIFGPTRVRGIAMTGTTDAATSGSEAGIELTDGHSDDDTWWTEADQRVCPICQPLHKTKRENWSRLFPSGPPAHPRCRCWIVYAAEKAGALATA